MSRSVFLGSAVAVLVDHVLQSRTTNQIIVGLPSDGLYTSMSDNKLCSSCDYIYQSIDKWLDSLKILHK